VIRRALLSVYDKTGIDALAGELADLGVELLASGGTAAELESLGLRVTRVEMVTDFPELLGGRVKTLHPKIHAGILARRDRQDDLAALTEHGIETIDLVCVNLYPFDRVAWQKDAREEDAVEMIDIGGPAMLRAAAKNFVDVVPLCSASQYRRVLDELREHGDLSRSTRRTLAAEAFAHTAAYEASITRWFGEREAFPERLVLPLRKERDLAYGENPHQRAAYYSEIGVPRHLLSNVEQVSGKDLSFNNLNDLAAARSLLEAFTLPACVIVKHANPCGCAVAASLGEAYAKALASDPVSAYGGIVVLNRPIDAPLAGQLAGQFVEVLLAPEIDDEALALLREKASTRILVNRERRFASTGEQDYRRVPGGMLVQDADSALEEREAMDVVSVAQPSEAAWGDLTLAWRVVKHVTSNAIVVARDLATIGVGSGQMSRVDAVRIAIENAREHGHDLRGAVLASDAFFPFPDGPQIALDAGVTAIIQPGGSKRDAEVIDTVDRAGAAMVFTGRRHFRH